MNNKFNHVTDISEKGKDKDGNPITINRRLFMQLQVFSNCLSSQNLVLALVQSGIEGVLYEDLSNPFGIGLLTFNEDPAFFTTELRQLCKNNAFKSLIIQPEMSMFGRTYARGHELDLERWLLHKPRQTVTNPLWPWAIWYPLRRSGDFTKISAEEEREILMEHGAIGHAFGRAELAHDVRLACYGLDRNDNDFIIGLIGKELHPLSAVVETMRRTRQTSEFISRLGPFFIGRSIWQYIRPAE